MKSRLVILSALLLLWVLPLAGGALCGFPEHFFRFPPLVIHPPVHAPFLAPVFWLFAVLGLLAAGILLSAPRPVPTGSGPPRVYPVGESVSPPWPSAPIPFPLHGKLGLILMLLSWILAWSRLDLPGPAEQHTFFPLWLGFIFTLDGLVFRRCGHSLYSRRRPAFLLMFPVSALSWWYFELLNRFVQNWWYPDRLDFGPLHYLIYSSLCFSTVLPAIAQIHSLLMTFPALRHRWSHGPPLHLPRTAVLFIALGIALLPLIPRFPDPLFWATWIAPLALLAGSLELAGSRTPFHPIKNGNWTPVMSLALAALLCGFFWELWNAFSSPRWAYAVPYVNRFHLFAMPAVGYAGYLPFGPVCACFWLAWTGLICRQGSGARGQGSAGSDHPFLNPES